MDNGVRKVMVENSKVSDKQVETFHHLHNNGMSNELIALITGYTKRTVDKYIEDSTENKEAWDKIQAYAKEMTAKAAEGMAMRNNSAIVAEIKKHEDAIVELRKKIIIFSPSGKGKSKNSIANLKKNRGGNINHKMRDQLKPDLDALMLDYQWHAKEEVEQVLRAHGYSVRPGCTSTIIRSVYGEYAEVEYGRYRIKRAA